MPDEEWPGDRNQRQIIISDFDLETEFGDRRQEIVFIGAKMDEKAICEQLDMALLSDEEMVKYRERYASVCLSLLHEEQCLLLIGLQASLQVDSNL